MANLTDIIKGKVDNSDLLTAVSGDTSYLGYWPDLTGSADPGKEVKHNGYTWVSTDFIADITLSEPSDANDSWYKKQDAVLSLIASQLTDGDLSEIGYIVEGVDVEDYTYLVWPSDGRVFRVGSVTGTLTAAFDPDDGSDAGLSGDLTNINSKSRREVILAAGTYTGSTYSYPNGRTQDDYESITVIGIGSTVPAPNDVSNNATITQEIIAANPTNWICTARMDTTINILRGVMARASLTTYTINDGADGGAVAQIIGVLKEGVV